jgi:hypothetical protein
MITMSRLSVMAAAVAVAFYLGGVLPAASQTSAPAAPAAAAKPATTASKKPDASTKKSQTAPKVRSGPHVDLLRGLMNIFSLGMDDLAEKLTRRGVYATLHNHAEWQSLSDQIAAQYKAGNHSSIVLVGHSLGADAVMLMGAYLGQKGVPVSLIVPFDGTASYPATSNVSRVMNLTQRDYARMTRGAGFRGELQNIDLSRDESIGHISIDKSARLHAMVVNKIVGVTGRGGGSPAPAKDPSASSSGAKPDSASASQASSSSAKPASATSVAR